MSEKRVIFIGKREIISNSAGSCWVLLGPGGSLLGPGGSLLGPGGYCWVLLGPWWVLGGYCWVLLLVTTVCDSKLE